MTLTTRIWTVFRDAAGAFINDYAPSMGAALAFYTMFSIAPLLFIVILVAGLIFGEEAATGEIFTQLRDLMGEQGAAAIQLMVERVSEPATGAIGTVVSALVLLVGATTVFAELQGDLDRIWRVPARDRIAGVWALVRTRLLSFGLILGLGFLLIVSLVASAALAALGKWWAPMLGDWETLARLLNFALSYALFTAAFALIYKFMPRAKIEWFDVLIGAAATALLFTIGKFLIGLYIGRSAVASGLGAAGSVIVVLLWVYYSAQIFLFGAEFTWAYAHEFGSRRPERRTAAPGAGAAEGRTMPVAAPRPATPVPAGSAGAQRTLPARPATPWALAVGVLLAALLARRGRKGDTAERRLRPGSG